MLTIESLNADKPLSVYLAIEFAEKALPIWEAKYPEDMRPRRAIEAAKEWLKNPSTAAANAVQAANAADNAAVNAAYASSAAAYAAYDAVQAANAADNAAVNAANAAYAAANALEADRKSLIHEVILENLDWILQYKIDNGQSFAEPELILSGLTEEQKQNFLFNLDAVA